MADGADMLKCSFCAKSQKQVRKLIGGPGVYICDECVELCVEIIEEQLVDEAETSATGELPTPREIFSFLSEYVIGQDEAKRALAVAVYNHYKRMRSPAESDDDVEIAKSNILLIGPTGTGKTYLAQTLARMLDVPFAIADATALTEAGYVGEDVENILLKLIQAAGDDIERAQRGIIYIDEIDKIARKAENSSITRDVSGEGVQQALLKIIEGTEAAVPPQGGRKHPHQQFLHIDTSNILFIVAGAFAGLDDLIRQRVGKRGIGFGAQLQDTNRSLDIFREARPEDFHKYGMIPEFIGRLPVITAVEELDEESLVRILTEPKNAMLKQYKKILDLDGVELEYTDDAIRAVANKAIAQGTGARGLRAIMEETLRDVMFDVPSRDDVVKVVVTKEAVEDGAPVTLVTSAKDRSKSA